MSEANNPVAEAEAPAAQELAPEVTSEGDESTIQDTGSADTSEGGESTPADDDEYEDVDYDGETYAVPKKLKEAFLRQADYTQKTQTLAEQRRQWEQQRQADEQQRAQQAEVISALREDVGKVHALETQLAQYKDVNWRQLQAQIAAIPDPMARQQAVTEFNLAFSDFAALEREVGQAKQALTEKEQALRSEQTQRVQAQMREALQTLQKDIPGFDQALANRIVEHGIAGFGLTAEEAQQLADPRIWKLLHSDRAKTDEIAALRAENAKLKGQRVAQTNNQAAVKVRPAVKVAGNVPETGLADNLSDAEWLKRREAQVRKRA